MTATGYALELLDEVAGRLVCTQVVDVTHDVRSFVLQGPAAYRFEAGQYLTVGVDVDDRRLERCYSISSSPTRPDALTITVKRVPGGPVSNWLHDRLRPGGTLDVAGPLGVFGAARRPSSPQLYLSAGSGITPLISMARATLDEDASVDLVLVHHARTPADIVFRAELAAMADAHPGVRVVVVCEQDADDERWPGHRGRISAEQLAAVAPDLTEREVFVCGPPAYRDAARVLLAAAGVDPARVHEESYVLGETGPGTVSPRSGAEAAATYAVELRRTGRTVPCPAGTTLLEAAADAGLTLPSSCGEGVCGTCKTTMLAGAVDMDPAGGIRPREMDQGKVLLCCSTPTEDVVLDV